MAFNGTEGASISLSTAGEWTENYRNANPNGVKAIFFGKDILTNILNQDNCLGIRIYFAHDDEGNQRLVLVGADAAEDDLIYGVVADYGSPCPASCSANNLLNS